MPRNLYWGRVNWNAPYSRGGSLNIKLYTLGGERPTSLRPVGRRLSHVLLSYIMSTGRINRALPYTCLLSARGIISINESTSTRGYYLVRGPTRSIGSYGRDENGKIMGRKLSREDSTRLSMHILEIDSRSKGLFNTFLGAAYAFRYFL